MKAILAATALLAGCALLQPPPKPSPPGFSAAAAANAVVIGKSTKADVLAALGEAVVIDFPSGYEVWVYREKSTPPGAELVLLFEPSGILSKTRVREAALR